MLKSSRIKREPVKFAELKEKNKLLKWKRMRAAEEYRNKRAKQYGKYKADWFLHLIKEATRTPNWTKWDRLRLRKLRKSLEHDHRIAINYYSAFIYFSTYRFLKWKEHDPNYINYVGFLIAEHNIFSFANYVSRKGLRWRKRNTRWPDNFEKRWGAKVSSIVQKIGNYDPYVQDDIMSKSFKLKLNKYS